MSAKPRKLVIAGNWKMNQNISDTEKFFQELNLKELALQQFESLVVALFPSYLSLYRAYQITKGSRIQVGAQNLHWEKKGAFTGEVSGPMVSEIGVHWALVGHSERRQYFGETDETVRKRAESLLEQGFHVIACIGETLEERDQGRMEEVLKRQLSGIFPSSKTICADFMDGRLMIAYEPVWAIGTGRTATPQQAEEAHRYIRNFITSHLGVDAAQQTPILYGGSVKPDNILDLLKCDNIDGALVGGASLSASDFSSLISSAKASLR